MDGIYEWVRNLIYYVIFLSIVNHLLADAKYEKYIRFFAGAVLILLALEPFLGARGMSERAAEAFSGLVFESRGPDMEEKLLHMEKQQQAMILEQYEAIKEEDMNEVEESGIQAEWEDDKGKMAAPSAVWSPFYDNGHAGFRGR